MCPWPGTAGTLLGSSPHNPSEITASEAHAQGVCCSARRNHPPGSARNARQPSSASQQRSADRHNAPRWEPPHATPFTPSAAQNPLHTMHGSAAPRAACPRPTCRQGCPEGGGGEGFVTLTETNVHGDALCVMVMGPSLLQRLAVGVWWLAVGGWRRLAVGGWWSLGLSLPKKNWGS